MLRSLKLSSFVLGLMPLFFNSAYAQDALDTPLPLETFEKGDLAVSWIHGSSRCATNTDPAIQVHEYNANLTILRENKCVNFEGPFIYIIYGSEKAIMIDTGATKAPAQFPIRTTVEAELVKHYGVEGRAKIELIVAHSHAHGDHILGDSQFKNQLNTTLVGTTPTAVAKFFGISNWPISQTQYDLGGRVLDIIPVPGHEASHIAIYDAQTGLLLTGDSLYPGRLYVSDWTAYRASVKRLVSFVADKEITHVLGAHIEMTQNAGVDFSMGSTFQPNEHDLPLTKDNLLELESRLEAIGPFPSEDVASDFIIYPI